MTLNNIQPSYSGTYICTAVTPEGDRGTGTATVTVTEDSKYHIINRGTGSATVIEDSKYLVINRGTGSATVTITEDSK